MQVWLNKGSLFKPPPHCEKAKQSKVCQCPGPETVHVLLCHWVNTPLCAEQFHCFPQLPHLSSPNISRRLCSVFRKSKFLHFLRGSNTVFCSRLSWRHFFKTDLFFPLCFCGVPACTLIAKMKQFELHVNLRVCVGWLQIFSALSVSVQPQNPRPVCNN